MKLSIFSKQNKTENLKIYFSDDQKIKSFGEILTSDSGRLILKNLLVEHMTANQISQKTGISLQLVKYHINKMQDIGIVNVSKITKNTKSHDMKFYVAERFAIMILPQTELDKIKQTVVDSVNNTSKITVIGISAISAWIMAHLIQTSDQIPIVSEIKTKSGYSGMHSLSGTIDESIEIAKAKVDIAYSSINLGSGTPIYSQEMFWIQVIGMGAIMACLAGVLFWKARRHVKKPEQIS